MKRTSAKEKGKEFEKEVGKILGMWWCGIPFPRAHGSGCSATIQCKHQAIEGRIFHHTGDLYVPEEFPWSVECKRQEGWTLEHLLEDQCGFVWQWWEQCCKDADLSMRWPLLVMRRNHRRSLVMIERDSPFDLTSFTPNHTIMKRDGEVLLICLLEDFLVEIDPIVQKVGEWRSRCDRIKRRKESLHLPSLQPEV